MRSAFVAVNVDRAALFDGVEAAGVVDASGAAPSKPMTMAAIDKDRTLRTDFIVIGSWVAETHGDKAEHLPRTGSFRNIGTV